ncbi:hypothetical protein D9619_012620 [Psilocybe cf. subviscida]|uniref:SH3 domain-containing protein n=1 Tax=Psilocybe cf. subviscida TaxID=2480587 RepID=A0A8H5EZ53_9AGAR|nr:hypothetical protein D9619_012620 [Psilocybe cf. subviscida]
MDKDYALSTSERPVSERPISEGVKSAQSPVHTAPHGSGNGSVRPEEQGHEQGHAIPPEEGYDVGNPPPQGKHALFLRAILVFGVVSWLIALVSQAVVASTLSNAPVRILWFAIIIQTYVLVLLACILLEREGLDSGFAIYAPQTTHFAVIATVFAVLGVDQNIYSPESSQQATGAGWLLLAMADIVLIVYLTGHPWHIVFRLFSALPLSSGGARDAPPKIQVERIGRSTEAFPMAPPGQGGAEPYETGEHAYTVPQAGAGWRTSTGNRFSQNRLSKLSKNRPVSQARNSRVTTSEVGSAAPSGMGNVGQHQGQYGAPGQQPHPGAVPPPKAMSEATSPDSEAQWRAVALFDYIANKDDPNEFDFKKGDVLLVFEKSGKWWESKLPEHTRKGVAPSNYLKLLE